MHFCTHTKKEDQNQNLISANRRLLVRKLSHLIGMSTTSMHRTLHDLKLYSYRLTVRQELKLGDYAKHLTYYHWFNSLFTMGCTKWTTSSFPMRPGCISTGMQTPKIIVSGVPKIPTNWLNQASTRKRLEFGERIRKLEW